MKNHFEGRKPMASNKTGGINGVTRLSRSKVESFMQCPRCFYLDVRRKVSAPSGPPFRLNSAVDQLLKNEFDAYRERGEPHPYMVEAGIDGVPAKHAQLADWRNNWKGVQVNHAGTGLLLRGAIDDLWQDRRTGKYIVVDYKATSKNSEVSLDAGWQVGYKRQMEFYQWLLRGNGLEVDDTGYFVYCNGISSAPTFGDTLRFKTKVIAYTGSDTWVEPTLAAIKAVLESDALPAASTTCGNCEYVAKVQALAGPGA
jgi:CRISPR/Cas system-associated exonuclease Cas4 (RecB family)